MRILVCAPVAAARRVAIRPRGSVRIATSAADAFRLLAQQRADVVVADTALARPDCAGFTRRLLAHHPRTVVVFAGAVSRSVAAAAVAAGARGVIAPVAGEHDLVPAVAEGILMASPAGAAPDRSLTAAREPRPRPSHVTLTDREHEVLQAMSEGLNNSEIGHRLYLSEDTVKSHARRLYRKLGVRDRAHAVATAFRTGLLT